MEPAPRIAIIGGGPMGLEAGLYGRYLGYDVEIFERGRLCENLLRCGHVTLFSTLGMNRSRLGLAALAAQDPAWTPGDDQQVVTGRELAEQYFLPLAASDLLADSIREQHEVRHIGRDRPTKKQPTGALRLLVDTPDGEAVREAEYVIDASGRSQHNWLGSAGAPAVGERALENEIEYGLPDILGAKHKRYAGRRTLVIGAGHAAATSIVALAQLAREAPGTEIAWIARGPVRRVADDRLPLRDALARKANELAASPHVRYLQGATIERIERGASANYLVAFGGRDAGEATFDRIIANVGHRPDTSLWRDLQVDLRSAAPVTEEANFFVLGVKCRAQNGDFSIADGLAQIQAAFRVIGGRAGLDLYATL